MQEGLMHSYLPSPAHWMADYNITSWLCLQARMEQCSTWVKHIAIDTCNKQGEHSLF